MSTAPLRVTFVCAAADMTGGFRVITIYAQRLRERGHDVLVVSRPARGPRWRESLRDVYHGARLPTLFRTAPTHADGTGIPLKVLDRMRTPAAADLPDADVVVATWWETAEWVWALPRSKGVKVHFVQDYEVWGGHTARVDATCRMPMTRITPSRWVEKLLTNDFGQHDVTCIPNAVDHAAFHAPVRGKQPVPTVGFTYTPFRAKGSDIAAEAIRLAREHRADLRVVCCGNHSPTRDTPLPPRAEFHHRAPDVTLRGLYSRCDAWLFASRKEGFGLPILEAMACRTPVIATHAGAAPELLADGGGRLVRMEDADAMAEAILEMCSMSDDTWRGMSAAAHATASRHTWHAATDQFEAVLRRAAVEAASPC